MSKQAALGRVDEPPLRHVSPADAATIIRTLGRAVVEAYGSVGAGSDDEATKSAWGSKQREQLLQALIERAAVHARTFENAALSATDAAIAAFAREEFKKGATRSRRDRAPITKNISKVVGGWLRRLGRKLRQDAVVVSIAGTVSLRDRTARCRLTLSFAYPRRVVQNRRLTLSARVEVIDPSGTSTLLPFRADPTAPEVTLREKQHLKAREARHLEQLLQSIKSFAEIPEDDVLREELRAYVDTGLRTFIPWSAPKILVAVFASLIACTAIAAAAGWVQQRIMESRLTPKITYRCNPAALVLEFPPQAVDGILVEKNGVVLPLRNGVAVDDHPAVGETNHYRVRSAKPSVFPLNFDVSSNMPACPPSPAACPTCSVSGTLELAGNKGTFDLTVDKSGLGDPPSILPSLTLETNHMDEHLDPFIPKDCDECRQWIHFRCYFGLVEGSDVAVTVDYGDGSSADVFKSAEARIATDKQQPLDSFNPTFARAKSSDTAMGEVYALHVLHHFPAEGSYVVEARVEAKASPAENFHLVKTLRRRVRVGTIATVEMTESYRLPEANEAPVPSAPKEPLKKNN